MLRFSKHSPPCVLLGATVDRAAPCVNGQTLPFSFLFSSPVEDCPREDCVRVFLAGAFRFHVVSEIGGT
jgi:hypothetical protein